MKDLQDIEDEDVKRVVGGEMRMYGIMNYAKWTGLIATGAGIAEFGLERLIKVGLEKFGIDIDAKPTKYIVDGVIAGLKIIIGFLIYMNLDGFEELGIGFGVSAFIDFMFIIYELITGGE